MKLIRYRKENKEFPGIMIGEKLYDVSAYGEDYTEAFFGDEGLRWLDQWTKENKHLLKELPADVLLACPVTRPSKIVCIGLNYADHARETNAATPAEPIIFMKSTTALTGPFDDIMIPRDSVKTDWEVELAVVIGKKAAYVAENEALNHVAGYCLHNDVSEREFQLERNGTWDKGKGCDSFAPIGPFLATPDEIRDVDNLRLWLSVNGKMKQEGNTSNFIFKIPFLISYVSRFMTLLPGDIISTGTPAGVALGMKVPAYLKAGDVVELGVEGLGISRQQVIAYQPPK